MAFTEYFGYFGESCVCLKIKNIELSVENLSPWNRSCVSCVRGVTNNYLGEDEWQI